MLQADAATVSAAKTALLPPLMSLLPLYKVAARDCDRERERRKGGQSDESFQRYTDVSTMDTLSIREISGVIVEQKVQLWRR